MTLASIECEDPLLLERFTGAFIADLILSNENGGRTYLSTFEYEIPKLYILEKLSQLWIEPLVAHNYSLFTNVERINCLSAGGSARVRLYQLVSVHRKARAAIYITTPHLDVIEKSIRVHLDTRITVINETSKNFNYRLYSKVVGKLLHNQVSIDLIPYRGKVWDAWYQL